MSPSTTHASVMDKEGNAVSLTQTISSYWGRGLVIPNYGFLMSNHFRQFPNYNPNNPTGKNYAAPLKTTRTVLAPTIVKRNGDVRVVIGTPGGGRIPQTVVQSIVALIDFDMELEAAIQTPKFFISDFDLLLEGGYSHDQIEALKALGHKVESETAFNPFFGGINGIAVDEDGMMTGVGSVRRFGGAAAPVTFQ